MKRVLVTGATGALGRHVLPLLTERGWHVSAVHNRRTRPDQPDVEWLKGDLLDAGHAQRLVAEAKADALLHLAWYMAPGQWPSAPQNFDWVKATLGLAEEFLRRGGNRLVSAGSCMEYDWNYGVCSEDRTPLRSSTTYGTCKHVTQLLLERLVTDPKTSYAWGRVFFLYGPYEDERRLVPTVIRALLAGQPAKTSHGRQIRDYLHVSDVAKAFVALLESDLTGPINIGSGEPVPLRDLVMKIGSLVGRPDLISLGAVPPASTDVPVVIADVSKLRSQLSWTPTWNLESGLRQTIDWWRGEAGHAGSIQ
jgi:nucleoside-diphosphate-sugar epimerase